MLEVHNLVSFDILSTYTYETQTTVKISITSKNCPSAQHRSTPCSFLSLSVQTATDLLSVTLD